MNKPRAVDRRQFVNGLGLAVLTVKCLPLSARASGDLIINSGPGLFSHEHELLIPYAVLSAPPAQGVELTSTKAMFHTHTIALTQKELITVNTGGTVIQKASSHRFVIALTSPKSRA